MGIKGIFEQTILRGGFNLAEMLERIDLYNVEAKISDEERESLYPAVYPQAWEEQTA